MLRRFFSTVFGRPQWGSALLAVYSFASAFCLFASYGLWAEGAQEIYLQFAAKYPNETSGYAWSLAPSLTVWNGLTFGVFAGLTAGILTFLAANSAMTGTSFIDKPTRKIVKWGKVRRSRDEYVRDSVSAVFVLCGYLIASSALLWLWFPNSVRDLVNLFFLLSYAIVTSAAAWMYVFFDTEKKRRRVFLSDAQLQIKAFEFDHVRLEQLMNLLIWVFVTLASSVILVSFSRYFIEIPKDIFSSAMFQRTRILTILVNLLIVALGFVGGLLIPTNMQIADLVDAVRDFDQSRPAR